MARLPADHRRQQILLTACEIASHGKLYTFTLEDVAARVGITIPGVKYYFYSATSLRTDVIVKAKETGHLEVLRQAIAAYDPLVDDLEPGLRDAAIESLR